MGSKFKIFAYFFLCFALVGRANAPAKEITNLINTEETCNLPAPAFVNVLEVGSTWAKIVWAPVPGAAHFLVETVDLGTGLIVVTQTVPGSVNSITVSPLVPGRAYKSIVTSLCNDGSRGGSNESPRFDSIIVDVVLEGFSPPDGKQNVECTITSSAGCPFGWPNGSITYFRVKKDNKVAVFRVKKINDGKIEINKANGYTDFNFIPGSGQFGYIQDNGVNVVELSAMYASASGAGWLLRVPSANNDFTYNVEKISFQSQLGNPGGGFKTASIMQGITAAPNPFADRLDVYIPFASVEKSGSLAVFDMQGRQVLQQQLPEATEFITLDLQDLQAGFYFLRVESDGQVEAIKLVKNQ